MINLSTNRLLRGNLGIPRVDMPQLGFIPEARTWADVLPKDPQFGGVDLGPWFWNHLVTQGVRMDHTMVPLVKLRPTQRELNCEKVTALTQAVMDGGLKKPCLFICREGHIIDGHHRWAAELVAAVRRGNLKTAKVQVSRAALSIHEVLEEADRFLDQWTAPISRGMEG